MSYSTRHKPTVHQAGTNTNTSNQSEMKIDRSPFTTNDHHIQIEGWLLKKSRVLKKWRKRWIVLVGNTLYSFKNKQQYNEMPTETINIHKITLLQKRQHTTKHFYFDIQLNTKLTFQFCSESRNHRELWFIEINKLINLNRSMIITKHHKNGKILSFGCKHFRRNASILCSCCNQWYLCSYCHDEKEYVFTTNDGVVNAGHSLERNNIIAMKCCKCGKEQKPNKYCIQCKVRIAEYFCVSCLFWDNDGVQKLYHCNKCGVCRYGKRDDYVHCDKCDVCLHKSFFKLHTKCMEESTKCDCPICGDYLHVTDSAVTFWPVCGHAIHVHCMEEFLVYDTLCPICRGPWRP